MRKIWAIVGLLSIFSTANADEKQTPTDAFRGATQFHMLMCKIKTQTEINKVQLGESTNAVPAISSCIKEGRIGAKKAYPPALNAVSKRPAAAKLLKDYYAAWLTAFDSVIPAPNETKAHYEQRLVDAESKYDEIWNRLEIEAGL